VVTQKLKETRLSNARALAAMLQPKVSDGLVRFTYPRAWAAVASG